MMAFDTIAEAMNGRGHGLFTGLPQLDRVAPLQAGHLAVLIGASGVGKTRVADHIASTVHCTHERGVLVVSSPTTIDALDSRLAFHPPALAVIDPLTTLTQPLGDEDAGCDVVIDQRPVDPPALGALAERLRDVACRRAVPILLCHRYKPIRDSVTGQIVSTESVNPLLDVADLVIVVRVLAEPGITGLEIIRNRLDPAFDPDRDRPRMIRVPLPVNPADDA